MDLATRLDSEVLTYLGCRLEKAIWYHTLDERFSIRLTPSCFYVSFFGYESDLAYAPTVGELKKLFFDRTAKLLL